MNSVLIIRLYCKFHDPVSVAALHKICDHSLAVQDIPGIDRFVPFDSCGFAGQQFISEKVYFQILCSHRHEGHHAGSDQLTEGRCFGICFVCVEGDIVVREGKIQHLLFFNNCRGNLDGHSKFQIIKVHNSHQTLRKTCNKFIHNLTLQSAAVNTIRRFCIVSEYGSR